MADTQTLSDPFKLPKGNADTSGKIPGQKDYNKNSQTKNTYKIDIPTRAGQTTGANENNPVAVYRVGVTQPIGTITSQSGFTPNPTYYSGVSAAEEKIRKAEQRAVREQTVEINKQVIKPTAEKAKIKPPKKIMMRQLIRNLPTRLLLLLHNQQILEKKLKEQKVNLVILHIQKIWEKLNKM